MLTDTDWAAYGAAGDAITAGDADRYAAIKAEAAHLDWADHDRRAQAVLAEVPYAELGTDPMWERIGLAPTAGTPLRPLAASEITRCASCKAPVYWSQTRGGAPCPYDVLPGNYGSATSHFTTCPNAKSHSSKKPSAAPRRRAA